MTIETVQAPFVLIGGKEDKLKGLQADLMLKSPSFYTELTAGKWFGEFNAFNGILLVKISNDGDDIAGSPDEVAELIVLLWEYFERENQQSFMRVERANRYAVAYEVQAHPTGTEDSTTDDKFLGHMKPIHHTMLGTVQNAVLIGEQWYSPR